MREFCSGHEKRMPITAAVQSVFARSNAGIVGSNSTQGMDICIVCIYSVFVLFCV
jgi:hypothetical protein